MTGGFLQIRSGLKPAFRSAVFGGVLLVRAGLQRTGAHTHFDTQTDSTDEPSHGRMHPTNQGIHTAAARRLSSRASASR